MRSVEAVHSGFTQVSRVNTGTFVQPSGTWDVAVDRIDIQRDLRIDLFRGFALLFVFTDHISEIASAAGLIGPHTFPLPTLRTITWTTAAEFFVFLSGYVAGMVYLRTFLDRGFWLCQLRALHRAYQIARANLVVFLFIVFLLSLAANLPPGLVTFLDIGFLRAAPIEATKDFMLGRYAPDYTDVLWLYVPLILLVPFMLWLLRYSRVAAFLLSAALYLTAQIFPLATLPMHSYQVSGAEPAWYFNPCAWQFLFFIGVIFGSRGGLRGALRDINLFRDRPRLAWGLVALVSVSSAEKILLELSRTNAFGLGRWLYRLDLHGFAIGSLRPLRLAHFFLIFFLALSLTPTSECLKRQRWLLPIVACGQNSLAVFATGIVLTIACVMVLALLGGGYPLYIAVAVFGVAIQGLTGVLLQWMKSEPWRAHPHRATA
jgi:hypothetical protein